MDSTEKLETAYVLIHQCVKHMHIANEAVKDIERQLRQAGMQAWPALEEALDVACGQMELADLQVVKARKVCFTQEEYQRYRNQKAGRARG
ncbi:MAG: hypothetical protein PUK59_07170 [Actinomycetaceae bacterium]|nr:hypothetical protein [Actinomycetaceae bacterium]MDY5854932.1 hypothetical protein [Arcanobacterium sp.]